MFGAVLSVLALVLVAWLFYSADELIEQDTVDSIFGGWVLRVLAVIFLLFTIMPQACTYTEQIEAFTIVQAARAQIKLSEEKSDNLSTLVRAELSKYPELEQKIVGEIKPEILLNFPQLRSSETMVEMLKQLVALQNEVYTRRGELIEAQRNIWAREISPWVVWVKSYQDFFNEPNPVTSK